MRPRTRQEQGLRGGVRVLRQRTTSHPWDHRESWREEMCAFGPLGRVTASAWDSSDHDAPQGHLHAATAMIAAPDERPVSVVEHAAGVTVRVHGVELAFGGLVARGTVEHGPDGRMIVRLSSEQGRYLGRVTVEHDEAGRQTRQCISGDVLQRVYDAGRPPYGVVARWRRVAARLERWRAAWKACRLSGTLRRNIAWLRWGADWHEVRWTYDASGVVLEEQTLALGRVTRRIVFTYTDSGDFESRRLYDTDDEVPRSCETCEYEYDEAGNWIRRTTNRWVRLKPGQAFGTGPVHEETVRKIEYYKVA